jgi:hypothetical protein
VGEDNINLATESLDCIVNANMSHKFAIGQDVHYSPLIKHSAARGIYKVTARLPVESGDRLIYRIKSAVEVFERTADESNLTLVD